MAAKAPSKSFSARRVLEITILPVTWTANATRALDPIQNNFAARYDGAYKAELDHFIDCLVNRTQPIAGFAEGREALRIADAAVESMESGRTVRLDA